MLAAWSVTVRRSGEVTTVKVTPAVIVAFERQYNVGVGQAFTENMKMEHLMWLAWEAHRRSGAGVKPFDEWVEQLDSIPELDVDGVPTDGTPSPT